MLQSIVSALAVLPLLVAAVAASAPASAQDDPSRSRASAKFTLTATGPRTSPFEPPAKDVFLTDASVGLDTGCTFNSSPLNPLTIDVVIDRFVGDVDANGFLVNPAPLIGAGIIPAAVDIVMPAFDVDFAGAAPPERDEVLFNGQSLGFLTGDNNLWKLNSFRVDIRKIKFPVRPAAGASPTPVTNRLQIRIDTLSSNRWCTQIDWVAIVLPIRPKLGLDLEAVAGATNPVRSDAGAAITKIQEQTFDAACNLTTTIGPIEQFPFSGAALTAANGAGSAKLRATIKACPAGSLKPPEVTADWSVDGTTKKGRLTWSGFSKEVEYQMPAAIGAYTATLKIKLDNGQDLNASRRLYVTRKAPLAAVAEPRIHWYKKGTEWANGETGETPIVSKIVSGLYGYGNASWRYGYDFGPVSKCNWVDLMSNPIACNYADCYVFSDVLDNIAGTLGVGGLAVRSPQGSAGRGFLTTGAPSLDPAFRGSARPLGAAGFNRYDFSSHSLRLRDGVYYDSTFNGRYATETAFIAANYTGATALDANGRYKISVEGPRVYRRAGNSYDSWGIYDYLIAPKLAPGTPRVMPGQPNAVLLAFNGATDHRTPDRDANGRSEVLEVDVSVNVLAAGNYVVVGELQGSGGQPVANRPSWQSMLESSANVSGAPGPRTITLRFSGEQIRQSRVDGPYNLVLYANSDTEAAGDATIVTPAFRWINFGELKAQLRSLVPTPLDEDASGRFETLRVRFEVESVTAGTYQVGASVVGPGGAGLAARSRLTMLAAGAQTVTIDLPATGIARAGIDGPYEVTATLSETNGTNIDSAQTFLTGLLASQFEPVVTVGATPTEQLIDSNANGLFDSLRVGAEVRVRAPRDAVVHGTLVGANGASVAVDTIATLATAAGQRVNLDFSGPLIRGLLMDSQYQLDLSFRNPTTFEEFDAVRVPLRGVYVYTQFDPAEAPRAIALSGARSDRGVDTNANGLFERLQIDLGVDLLAAGSCEWSARLVDRNGAELGFAAGSGSLAAGSRTIRLEFDGRAIGTNGLDGPYSVRSLLMACTNGANLVATFAGDTSAWRANQFEGFIVRAPADLNGDGRVDAADIAAFNLALGSSLGDANYNRFADFDRDGRITLNDLRIFRSYLPR